MRKWLIGLGGLVLLRVVSGLHPAEPDRMTGHVPSHWDRAGSATLPIGERKYASRSRKMRGCKQLHKRLCVAPTGVGRPPPDVYKANFQGKTVGQTIVRFQLSLVDGYFVQESDTKPNSFSLTSPTLRR